MSYNSAPFKLRRYGRYEQEYFCYLPDQNSHPVLDDHPEWKSLRILLKHSLPTFHSAELSTQLRCFKMSLGSLATAASRLDGFCKIGPRTSLFTPSKPTPGQLVIICTWLGAAPKHIAKYTGLYQSIAPGARILLIESNVPTMASSYNHQRDVIKPAVSVVLDTLAELDYHPATSDTKSISNGHLPNGNTSKIVEPRAEPKVLLHTSSNGGTNTATQLLLVLNSKMHSPLPLAGLVCDSCPANGTYWKSHDAMVLSLPKNSASRLLGALVCHCILIVLYTWIACGNENPASLNRRTMLDPEIVSPGWEKSDKDREQYRTKAESKGRVCYLYSKADRMCHWEDVKEHAEKAKAMSWSVKEIIFDGSGHCAHFSKDEEKYAKAVKSLWQGSVGEWDVQEPSL